LGFARLFNTQTINQKSSLKQNFILNILGLFAHILYNNKNLKRKKMKKTIFIVLLFASHLFAERYYGCLGEDCGWKDFPKEEKFINNKNCDQILDYKYYKICYSYKYKAPIYLYYDSDNVPEEIKSKYFMHPSKEFSTFQQMKNYLFKEGRISRMELESIEEKNYFKYDEQIPLEYRANEKDLHHEFKIRNPYYKDFLVEETVHIFPQNLFSPLVFGHYDREQTAYMYRSPNYFPIYEEANHLFAKARGLTEPMYGDLKKKVVVALIYDEHPLKIGKSQVSVPTQIVFIHYRNKNYSNCYVIPNTHFVDSRKENGEIYFWKDNPAYQVTGNGGLRTQCRDIIRQLEEKYDYNIAQRK
jgi:hypothetical protein